MTGLLITLVVLQSISLLTQLSTYSMFSQALGRRP